jgi:hypothetical protein
MKHFKFGGIGLVVVIASLAASSPACAATLEVGGVAQNKAVAVSASLSSGTSMTFRNINGELVDTCTGSTLKFATETPFTAASVGGKVSSLTFTGCSHTTTVINPGKLSVAWTSGTNGSLTSAEAEVTIVSTFFGASAVCKSGVGSQFGTITGVKEGNANIDLNAKFTCGILSDVTVTGTYSVTSPSGLQGLGVVS